MEGGAGSQEIHLLVTEPRAPRPGQEARAPRAAARPSRGAGGLGLGGGRGPGRPGRAVSPLRRAAPRCRALLGGRPGAWCALGAPWRGEAR